MFSELALLREEFVHVRLEDVMRNGEACFHYGPSLLRKLVSRTPPVGFLKFQC